MTNRDKNQPPSQNRGKNLGQGLTGIKDHQRRDLAGSGDEAPTKDQSERPTSGERGTRDDAQDSSGGRH